MSLSYMFLRAAAVKPCRIALLALLSLALLGVHAQADQLQNISSFAGGAGGSAPQAPLVQTGDGSFYGTTQGGGAQSDGTIFRLSADGTAVTVLYAFTGAREALPSALIRASDGSFYGTTQGGDANGNGTVFRLSPDGSTLTTLHSFTGIGTEGINPAAALLKASDGSFYGTTQGGGANNNGTIFRLSADGVTLTTLHSFSARDPNTVTNVDGANPSALIQGSDGSFYGTTYNYGTNSVGTLFRQPA